MARYWGELRVDARVFDAYHLPQLSALFRRTDTVVACRASAVSSTPTETNFRAANHHPFFIVNFTSQQTTLLQEIRTWHEYKSRPHGPKETQQVKSQRVRHMNNRAASTDTLLTAAGDIRSTTATTRTATPPTHQASSTQRISTYM